MTHAASRPGSKDRARSRVRRTMKDDVAAYVREAILSGELKPGSRLNADDIAEAVGVSKLPVREALIQLEGEGLVESPAHRGSFVAPLSPDDVRDHYYLYGLVCGVAAERATERLDSAQLDELEAIVDRMEQLSDPAVLEELNIEFHRRLNKAGSSRRLLAVLKPLANSLPANFYEFSPGWPHEANEHHREIVRHLRAGDAQAAGRAVTEHLRVGADFAVAMLRARGYWSENDDVQPDSN